MKATVTGSTQTGLNTRPSPGASCRGDHSRTPVRAELAEEQLPAGDGLGLPDLPVGQVGDGEHERPVGADGDAAQLQAVGKRGEAGGGRSGCCG